MVFIRRLGLFSGLGQGRAFVEAHAPALGPALIFLIPSIACAMSRAILGTLAAQKAKFMQLFREESGCQFFTQSSQFGVVTVCDMEVTVVVLGRVLITSIDLAGVMFLQEIPAAFSVSIIHGF